MVRKTLNALDNSSIFVVLSNTFFLITANKGG